ncbi:response regulator [Paenibacillus hunanensis]|uniref:response regulator n=1 Tax=Paenibacillus hunanensis TaxID=539262 RepID=UPI002026AA48|nr:response regulator [Paenibacillus hunanensis]MCL9661089.1 response regulator [Paenibacillus hunanensis]
MESKSMLYIGQDPINLQLVRYLLSKKFPHIELIQVGSSDEAMLKLGEDSPALVLVDIQLPITEEYTIPDKLKQQADHESTPIWAVSGCVMEQDIIRAYRSGFDRYFTKPLHLLSFTHHLRRELDG